MTRINDIITSTDPDRPDLKVLGSTEAGEWIVQEDDAFGAPRTLEPDEFKVYDIDSTPERINDSEAWRRLGEAQEKQPRRVLPQRQLSPEEALAADEGSPVSEDGDGWSGHPGIAYTEAEARTLRMRR